MADSTDNYFGKGAGPSMPMTHGPNPKPHGPAIIPVPSPFEGKGVKPAPNIGPIGSKILKKLYKKGPAT